MDKRLMAVAVAGALAVPVAAYAQSTVQIYGRVTYEYGWMDQGDGLKDTDSADTPGGSAIGFKGTEQLGGGVSAWFQCESSADISAHDTGGFCTRNSAVGFRGGFGNIFAGKWDTPMKRALGLGFVGAESTGLLGMSFLPYGGSGGTDASGTGVNSPLRHRWFRRESNLITYETPRWGGFQVMGAWSAGNRANELPATVNDDNARPRVISVGGTYVNGPLGVGLAYEKHSQFGAFPNAGGPAITDELDDDAWGVAVGYRIGPVRLGASFLKSEYETGGGDELRKKAWTVGADWNVAGPHTISLFYADIGDSKGNSDVGVGGSSNGAHAASDNETGGHAWSLAYQYAFSKRTTVKIGYVRVDNDDNTSTYRVGNAARPLNDGAHTDGVALLVKHNF